MAGSSRFEIVPPNRGRTLESSLARGSRSCHEAVLSPASLESLRHTLVANDFCKLQAIAEADRRPLPTDAGWVKLEAHLAGVSCVVAFPPPRAQRANPDGADAWSASLRPPFRAVFEAFDHLEREVRGPDADAGP
jgi:hypothetical protein